MFYRSRLEKEPFWAKDSESAVEKRRKFFKKAAALEKDFNARRKHLNKVINKAKNKLENKATELRRAKHHVLKANAGLM